MVTHLNDFNGKNAEQVGGGGGGGQTSLLIETTQLSGTLFGKYHTIKLTSRFLRDSA